MKVKLKFTIIYRENPKLTHKNNMRKLNSYNLTKIAPKKK